MVEDAISDPKRIAQLLASELTGLATGPLADVAVVDADQSATPSPDGTVAYAVAVDGDTLGRTELYPDAAVIVIDGDRWISHAHSVTAATDRDDFTVETSEDEIRLTLSSGVAVKRAVDVIRDLLAEVED